MLLPYYNAGFNPTIYPQHSSLFEGNIINIVFKVVTWNLGSFFILTTDQACKNTAFLANSITLHYIKSTLKHG